MDSQLLHYYEAIEQASADMLAAKSPGDGISANHLAELIGRVAAVEVLADTLLPVAALSWQHTQARDGVGSSA